MIEDWNIKFMNFRINQIFDKYSIDYKLKEITELLLHRIYSYKTQMQLDIPPIQVTYDDDYKCIEFCWYDLKNQRSIGYLPLYKENKKYYLISKLENDKFEEIISHSILDVYQTINDFFKIHISLEFNSSQGPVFSKL